jgi:hypothetical protein
VKLVEALEALKRNPAPESPPLEVQLACGFTPLHFLTFLGAHLRGAFPDHRVRISTGTFGDLPGNLERLATIQDSTIVAVIEWQDLDPRLGIRLLGGWNPGQLSDFAQTVRDQAARVVGALGAVAQKNTVIVALPTLPIPPVAFTPGWLSSRLDADLLSVRATLLSKLTELSSIRVVSSQWLDQVSPLAERFDAKSELNTGFPYTLSQSEMSDNVSVFIFVHELFGTAKCHLVNIFINLIPGHAHPFINNAQCFFFGIQHNINSKIAKITFCLTHTG